MLPVADKRGQISACQLLQGPFDVIYISHSLGSAANPDEALLQSVLRLKPGLLRFWKASGSFLIICHLEVGAAGCIHAFKQAPWSTLTKA